MTMCYRNKTQKKKTRNLLHLIYSLPRSNSIPIRTHYQYLPQIIFRQAALALVQLLPLPLLLLPLGLLQED